ncbi:hypothetical protein N9901_02925, partial [Flavobacteriaceae bacterium]|nr:hypothetical protein [Flavobacteriaceae bacterium]
IFNKLITNRCCSKNSTFSWISTSEIEIDKIPEKRLSNFTSKIEEINNRLDFIRIQKINIATST